MSSDGTIGLERGRPLSQAAPLVVGLGYRAFRTVIRITHFPMASSRLTLFIAFPLSLLFGRPYRLPTSIIIGQPLYNAILWGYHHISFISDRIFVTRFKELRRFSSRRDGLRPLCWSLSFCAETKPQVNRMRHKTHALFFLARLFNLMKTADYLAGWKLISARAWGSAKPLRT